MADATERGELATQRGNLRLHVAILGGIAAAAVALSLALGGAGAAAAQPDQLIVRAAGTTGTETMVLKLNGTEVERWTTTKSMTDYTFSVSEDTPVRSVEVSFLNDNGPRDLTVASVNIAGTVLRSNATATTSTGTFVSSDGGCKSRSSTSTVLHCNGSFTYSVPSGVALTKSPTSGQVVVRARGTSGEERLQLRINGAVAVTETVGRDWQLIIVPLTDTMTSAEVRFINDAGGRDLQVDYLEVAGQRYQSEASTTTSTGTYANGDCIERASSSEWLHCAGSFVYPVAGGSQPTTPTVEPTSPRAEPIAAPVEPVSAPVAPTTTTTRAPEPTGDTVTVRALGRSGSESMQLRIDGEAVKSWTVGTSMASYSFTVPDVSAISTVEVQFVNDGSGRDLRVDYLELDGERYQSESSQTRSKGTYAGSSGCGERDSTSEWLHCSGWFRYAVSDVAVAQAEASRSAGSATQRSVGQATASPSVNGRYSIAQVIDGTIGAGDGSNPNEESPMGRHEAPLYLPQGWNWAQGPSRNSVWGQLGTGGSRFAEWRCAVIPENGHNPSVPFRINVRNGAYYQFANNSWQKGFDVDLTGGNHGGYLGQAGRLNNNPFSSGSHGQIQWRREADGSYSAPWNSSALMMHFWAGQRKAPASGQTAEFLTSEVRLQQPDGQTVDLSKVNVLFQCGVDYYNTTGGQGTQVPGPGIAKYNRVTPDWRAGLWVTLPRNAPANSTSDFRQWLQNNTPPNVSR